MSAESGPSTRRRWIVAAVLVLAIGALLAARAYVRQQRAEEDSDDLLEPDVLAQEIADDLQTALEQFAVIAAELRG